MYDYLYTTCYLGPQYPDYIRGLRPYYERGTTDDSKQHMALKLYFLSFGEWKVHPSLLLLPGPPESILAVPARVSCIS